VHGAQPAARGRDVDDVVVDLETAGAGEDDVDLLALRVEPPLLARAARSSISGLSFFPRR